MGLSSANQKAVTDWFDGFGDPTRLTIVFILSAGSNTVSEIARLCNTEIVNVSHHLSVMRSAGLVTNVRDGRHQWYSLVGCKAVGSDIILTHPSGAMVTIPVG